MPPPHGLFARHRRCPLAAMSYRDAGRGARCERDRGGCGLTWVPDGGGFRVLPALHPGLVEG